MSHTDHDPRGLIAEAYRIDGLSLDEARSIFFDWALSRPDGAGTPDAAAQIAGLLTALGAEHPADHPMSVVLSEGLPGTAAPKGRRGGAAGRRN